MGVARTTLALLVASLAGCAAAQRPHRRVASAYRFECTPADAHVVVDEVDQGQCVLWQTQYLGVGSGSHRLQIQREGYLDMEQDLPETRARQTVHVRLREVPE